MNLFRRWRSGRSRDVHESPDDPVRALQGELEALERQLEADERHVADVLGEATLAERHAMEAIRAGDDQTARAALLEQRAQAEQAAAIEADIKVLRALINECRETLANRPNPEQAES